MSELLYVRTVMSIPQVGTSTHVAELAPLSPEACQLVRIVELDTQDSIQGAATQQTAIGLASTPAPVVPHPDSYHQFPDIQATMLTAEQFEVLWTEAVMKFPELG